MRHKAGFYAIALVLVAWTVVMCIQEPILFDGWFVLQWKGSFLEYVRANWTGELVWGNPRIGQWATYATYDLAWHVVLTPLFVLGLFTLLLVHLRGRWPDPARDAWPLLVLVALAVLGQPQLGPVLFYRPFTANYVVGLIVQLAWLVPYRFALDRRPGREQVLVALGLLAGACNEHTGPALVVAGGVICVVLAKRGRLRAWHVLGLAAFVAGYVLMMTAPAQATRYCGVGEGSLVDRLAGRSVIASLRIVLGLALGGRWMWVALAVAWLVARRRPPRAAAAWILLGAAISLTMLLSPKQGDRLLFAALAFASLGVATILESFDRLRKPIAIAAAGVLAYAVVHSIVISSRVAADARMRMALLAAASPDAIVAVPPLREPASRWFVGDDFWSDALRHQVAHYYGLAAIDLAGRPLIPYQFAIRYEDAGGAHAVKRFVPLNQCEARRAFGEELARPGVTSAELAIVARAPVFAQPLASSRWRGGKLVAPRASVENELGTRYLSIDRGGLEGGLEVTLIGPGKTLKLPAEGARFPYKPWQPGTYWVVVCAGGDCYLADTIRHKHV